MVLIDPPSIFRWSHMVATDIQELHEFAELIGLKRCYFSNKKGKNQPHYDVRGSIMYEKAIRNGANQVSRKELFMFLETNYGDSQQESNR